MTEFKNILVAKSGPVARVTFNRPDFRNALSLETRKELKAALAELRADPEVRVLVFNGAGKGFIAGADLRDLVPMNPPEAWNYVNSYGQALYGEIASFPWPTIAAIHGFALGGGFELALACDIRIAAEGALFGAPEVNVGIFPGGGGTQRLFTAGLPGYAAETVLLGENFDAKEAHRRGIVNRVVPPEKLEEEVAALAKKLAEKPPVALRLAKEALAGADRGNYKLEAALFATVFASEDQKEGMRAFLEKRKPVWKGR
ncbi:MAG: enoyl-CoA hydratase-related protein [Halobacteria archaeon]